MMGKKKKTMALALFVLIFPGGFLGAQQSGFLMDYLQIPQEELAGRVDFGNSVFVQATILAGAEKLEEELLTEATVVVFKELVEEAADRGKLEELIIQLEEQEEALEEVLAGPEAEAEPEPELVRRATVLRMCLSMAYGIKGDMKKKEAVEERVRQTVEKRSLTVALFADYGIATYSAQERDLAWKLENLSLRDVLQYGDAIFEFIQSPEEARRWIDVGIREGEWDFARLVLGGSLDRGFIEKRYHDERSREIDAFLLARQIAASMVPVLPGTFLMGSENGSDFEKPVRQVAITIPYSLSDHEVRFSEWDAYCSLAGIKKPEDRGWGRDDRPVILVSWREALEFCNWLSASMRLTPAYQFRGREVLFIREADGFRLPTEAEWEYAAMGGEGQSRDNQLENLAGKGWYADNADGMTLPGKQLLPNPLGLYDMQGNVWEMCWDYFQENYYSRGGTVDPVGPEDGNLRVVRGGSYSNREQFCTYSYRFFTDPRKGDMRLGFRLARNYEE